MGGYKGIITMAQRERGVRKQCCPVPELLSGWHLCFLKSLLLMSGLSTLYVISTQSGLIK